MTWSQLIFEPISLNFHRHYLVNRRCVGGAGSYSNPESWCADFESLQDNKQVRTDVLYGKPLVLTLQSSVKGSCWMLLLLPYVFASRKASSGKHPLTSVPLSPPVLGSAVAGSFGSRQPLLCRCCWVPLRPETLQMTKCIRLTNPHVLRVRQAAKRSALSQRGEKALGIPIIRTSVSVCCLVSGDRASELWRDCGY